MRFRRAPFGQASGGPMRNSLLRAKKRPSCAFPQAKPRLGLQDQKNVSTGRLSLLCRPSYWFKARFVRKRLFSAQC